MRKPFPTAPSSSRRPLALALLCAFACLNPLPEEYPSDTSTPGNEPPGAAGAENSDQAADGFEANTLADPNGAPEAGDARLAPPSLIAPDAGADGGVDGGVVDEGADAGAPALSE